MTENYNRKNICWNMEKDIYYGYEEMIMQEDGRKFKMDVSCMSLMDIHGIIFFINRNVFYFYFIKA